MPDGHPDDEQLSALLDLDAPDADEVHVRECATCTARLEALRGAAQLVASPVTPLTPGAIDQMVAEAMRSRVVPITASTRRLRRMPSPPALGAIAAVLVFLLAMPVLLGGLGGGGDDAGEAALTAGGDESEQAEGSAEALDTTAGGGSAAGAGSAAEATVTNDAATVAAPATAARAALGAFDDDGQLVRALTSAISQAGQDPKTEETTPDAPTSCEGAAREVGGSRLGGLLYAGALNWRSTDAEVLVFFLTEPVDGLTRQAYVMALGDCRVLSEPRF